jgi:tetraprenyl-beta-curcumene synthase
LFWVIPRRRSPALLKLLVAYQVMWDFLDNVSESGAGRGLENGLQLHLALIDAVDRDRPVSDYYRHHPWEDDGGYLRSLVQACRAYSSRLPSFDRMRPLLVREARRAGVQAINHETDALRRDAALRRWVAREWPAENEVTWFELAGAAGAGISIYALFALAVERSPGHTEIEMVYRAYFPWASALATMLDSYVDQWQDAASGDHVYIDHYVSFAAAQAGIGRLIRRSLIEVQLLPNGGRHCVVIAAMIAMYLSKDSAIARDAWPTTLCLLRGAGSLPSLLMPVLRLWRVLYGQGSC